MSAVASQITSITTVYSTVYSGADQRKHKKIRVTGFCEGNSQVTDEFPAQMASNAENVSIWWRHHDINALDIVIVTFKWNVLTKRFIITAHVNWRFGFAWY